MKQIAEVYKKNRNIILMILGLCLASFIVLPCLFLGQGSFVEVHDQLDGEVLNYMYRAKYLFHGDIIPEFMNGMSKAAMAMPAPFGVLLYKVFSPFTAFTLMQWMGGLVGFAGMYCLCRYLNIKEEIGFVVALLFAYLPFYPVYGLAAYGQPMLVLCMLQIAKEKKQISALLGIVMYAGFSSLTLVGYVWVVLGFVYVGYLAVVAWNEKKEKKQESVTKLGYTALGWGALVVTYILTNLELIASVLGKGFESHRSEMVLHARNEIVPIFLELFFKGGAYSKTYSVGIFAVAVLGTALAIIFKGKTDVLTEDLKKGWKKLWSFIGVIAIFSACAVLWNVGPMVNMRKALGGIVTYFQADRVYWIFPFLWMVVLAFLAQWIYEIGKEKKTMFARVGSIAVVVILFLAEGGQILRDSTLNKNVRLLLVPGYQKMTWQSFYMDDVFERIDEKLKQPAATSQKSVISLGMYPSIALYHGYTCADGYSNNYELSYKHEFRKMFAGELEQSVEMQNYFDDWGNRLYVADAEYGFHTLMPKGSGFTFKELDLDMEAVKAMNVGYIFSAAPIENAEELKIVPVGGSPFSTDRSFYEVWVYEVQ